MGCDMPPSPSPSKARNSQAFPAPCVHVHFITYDPTSLAGRGKARSRAPTLVGRYEAKAAEKATDALFAQLAGGAGAEPKPKARSKEEVIKQRAAFNNIAHKTNY
eukprot:1164370-Prorocentrum_minimum.AAC.2